MEAGKQFILETLRVILIAGVSYLATDMVIAQLVTVFAGSHLTELQIIEVTAILSVIVKAVDRSLHESKIAEKGLTRF